VADGVEEVRGIPLTRNNRIIGVDRLNRTCVFDASFESILLRHRPKILFQQHRPKAAVAGIRAIRRFEMKSRRGSVSILTETGVPGFILRGK
jgi:hypothetical protein